MRKKMQSLALAAMLCSMNANAQLSTNPDKFLGNITTSYNVDYGAEKYYTLWNQITCENESKWASIEGNNNNFNFGGSDNAYNYAKNHNFPFKFHALVWGSQYPSWLEAQTPEQRYKEIVQWMDNVKAHYPNLQMIDVVNEAIDGHQSGTKYFIEALGGKGETGYDWIIKAFELAYERWPNAILIYNDFNTFQWNTDQYITLVKTLRNAGAPIDAYGCQSHDLTDISFTSFKNSMAKLQNALKMPMYSTEYDIGTTDDAKQLKQYQDQIPYMWEQDYCAGITLWGYIYGKTWTTDGNSGIIKDGKDRPAMTWLREYMKSDAAKNAKSPFPGMVKEASVYIKPLSLKLSKGIPQSITVRAKMRTKTIEKVELYAKDALIATMTEAPYVAYYTPGGTGTQELKAIVTCTDGSTYERYSTVTVAAAQTPYQNKAAELPGVVEAENFDVGVSGIAYYDSNNSKEGNGSAYRTDGTGVDVIKGGTGYGVGYTHVGEWVEYTVDVKEAGLYAVNVDYSANVNGASYTLAVVTPDGPKVLTDGDVTVPSTSKLTTYKTAYTRCVVPLEAGQQTLRLSITGGGDNALNFDKMTFEHINVDENIGITLSTLEESPMVSKESIITADVTSSKDIKSVNFYEDGILAYTATTAPYQFGYIPMEKGKHTITAFAVDADGTQSKIASSDYTVLPLRQSFDGIITIPGIIEAENFDKGGEGYTYHDSDNVDEGKSGYRTDNDGVDIKKINSGGYALGYTVADEWVDYTVNVTQTGKYSCSAVVSSGVAGAKFKVGYLNGDAYSYPWLIAVPNNGENVYSTVTAKTKRELTAGKHFIRLYITGANCNIDKLEFKLVEASGIDDITIDDNLSADNYTITGQRVGSTYRGIYIKNGKKFMKR